MIPAGLPVIQPLQADGKQPNRTGCEGYEHLWIHRRRHQAHQCQPAEGGAAKSVGSSHGAVLAQGVDQGPADQQQHQRAGVSAATEGRAPQDRLIRGIHPVPREAGHGDGEQILGIDGGGKNGVITDVRKKDGCRHGEGGQGNEGDGNDIV